MKLIFVAALALSLSPLARAGEVSGAVLAEINLARTKPQTYAKIVASRSAGRSVDETVRFLNRAAPLRALAASRGLGQAALSHVRAQGDSGGVGHRERGENSSARMSRFGQWLGCAGENIDYGSRDPRSVVVRLIVDEGVPGKGHRANIFNRDFGVAGAAVGGHPRFGAICVVDFAGAFAERGTEVAAR